MTPAVESAPDLADPLVWRAQIQEKVDKLEGVVTKVDANVTAMQGSVRLMSKIFWPFVPIAIVATGSFVIMAYVAFARFDDARQQQHEHEHTDIALAHPGAAEQMTKIREEQSGTRSDIQSFLREQAQRDQAEAARLERIERQLDQMHERRR